MQPVLIAGFHRSGTSWVARALHHAGMHLGDQLLGAEPSNPYGHFEDETVIALHDAALADQDLTWKSTSEIDRPCSVTLSDGIDALVQDRTARSVPWAIKDPRLCLFLPEWLHAAPRSRVLIVIRRPDEAIRSLHRRHAERWVKTRNVDPTDLKFWEESDLGLRLWIHYNQQLLYTLQTTGHKEVHVVDWNDPATTDHIVGDLELKWALGLGDETLGRDFALGQAAVDPIEVRDPTLIEHAEDIWRHLQGLRRRQVAR